jgi:hypothetical protein
MQFFRRGEFELTEIIKLQVSVVYNMINPQDLGTAHNLPFQLQTLQFVASFRTH